MTRTLRRLLVVLLAVAAFVPAAAVAEPSSSWTGRRVLNVAHAGGDLEAPHSTLYAMRRAVEGGADVLEMDVRLSADGVLMVHHDTTLDRTTGSSGAMRDRTAAELGALDNAYWFVPGCWSCHDRPAEAYTLRGIRTGERPAPTGYGADDFAIPTLAQVDEAFPDRILDIEIKDGPDALAAAEALASFIADHGPVDRYLVASFDDAVMAHFTALAPDVATSPGLGETVAWVLGGTGPLPGHRVLQVPPVYDGLPVVTASFVDAAHAVGLSVWVWFNGNDDDSPDEWRRLVDLGVDGLITGKPAAAEAVLTADRVRHTVAPVVDPRLTVRRDEVRATITCPPLHVATCTGRLVLVGLDRHGRVTLVADGAVAVRRGDTAPVPARFRPGGRAVLAGDGPLVAAVLPGDGDTALGGVFATVG